MPEQCIPCMIGVPIEIAKEICRITQDNRCQDLTKDLIDKKITVDDYFNKVEQILDEKKVDEGFKKTLSNARSFYENAKAKSESQQSTS